MDGSIGANRPKQSNEKSAHSIRGRARSRKFEHRQLKIFSATTADLRASPAKFAQKENELIVAAAEGALSFGEVQLEGKRRMSAAEFLRGHHGSLGCSRRPGPQLLSRFTAASGRGQQPRL